MEWQVHPFLPKLSAITPLNRDTGSSGRELHTQYFLWGRPQQQGCIRKYWGLCIMSVMLRTCYGIGGTFWVHASRTVTPETTPPTLRGLSDLRRTEAEPLQRSRRSQGQQKTGHVFQQGGGNDHWWSRGAYQEPRKGQTGSGQPVPDTHMCQQVTARLVSQHLILSTPLLPWHPATALPQSAQHRYELWACDHLHPDPSAPAHHKEHGTPTASLASHRRALASHRPAKMLPACLQPAPLL